MEASLLDVTWIGLRYVLLLHPQRPSDKPQNLGLDQFKCIQVWHPDGAFEHTAIGYTVVYGALTGMNAKGLSVHEANLESVRLRELSCWQ